MSIESAIGQSRRHIGEIESNFLRLVKLFHAHKDVADRQFITLEARLMAVETALKGLLANAPKEK